MDGKDTLALMPTWAWKSLTYQLPAICFEGLTIVITPLISLMKDQVDKLQSLWIKAEMINSTMPQADVEEIMRELENASLNNIKLLYVAPERLNSRRFLNIVKKQKISQIAIDEAHCISQWGHDFRVSYLKIKDFISSLKSVGQKFPTVALTATATEKVRKDVTERLALREYNTFVKWFDRKNIAIIVREVSKKEEKEAKVLEIINKTPGCGIIYCASIKATEELFWFLNMNWIPAWIYHGSMNSIARDKCQNEFMSWKYKVIVATNAFWMGIDKDDVRFVIHYNLPWTIENYYQEAGRAWRDWKNSYSVVLASYRDVKVQEFFIENTYPTRMEIQKLYEHLYKPYSIWSWAWEKIQKTYFQLASETDIKDSKIWSILRVFEKYWIAERGSGWDSDFKWKGIRLIEDKKETKDLLIDYRREEALEKESYVKLDEIKHLLFDPTCRKKFILEYFWDEIDLKNVMDWCWSCDFCIAKKNAMKDTSTHIPLSIFDITLDAFFKMPREFWQSTMVDFLYWTPSEMVIKWWLTKEEFYWVLSSYKKAEIKAIIEALISKYYLEKSTDKFPTIKITGKWEKALFDDKDLKSDLLSLQSFVYVKR